MKKLIYLFVGFVVLISGCTNKDMESLKEEKELLSNEVLELKNQIFEKEEEIKLLKEDSLNYNAKLSELSERLEMVRWSANARFFEHHTFTDLTNTYRIHSEHIMKDDWYVINEDNFEIELLNYENAEKVVFYVLRLESEQGPIPVFTDTDRTDGWRYTDETIGKIIDKHKGPDSYWVRYEPYFLLYTEVTMEDGEIIKTPNLPIYNK